MNADLMVSSPSLARTVAETLVGAGFAVQTQKIRPLGQALAPLLPGLSSDIVIVDSTASHEQADLQAIEAMTASMDAAIHKRIGLVWPVPPTIAKALRVADLRALATEKRDLMEDGPEWRPLPAPWRAAIKPWPWIKAEERFLAKFDELAIRCGLPTRDRIDG